MPTVPARLISKLEGQRRAKRMPVLITDDDRRLWRGGRQGYQARDCGNDDARTSLHRAPGGNMEHKG